MSAGSIGGAGLGATGAPSSNRFAEMKSEDFIRVLVEELSNQDPFSPQDSGALLEQLSSLRNIESQMSLQGKLETLVLQNEVSAASGMIGQMVSGLDENNNPVVGLVTSVRVQAGKAVLELDTGHALPMDHVTRIDAAPTGAAA